MTPHNSAVTNRYPTLLHVALDAENIRELAEFYRQLFGLSYRPGDEIPTDGSPDDSEWLVLRGGTFDLAFQQTERLERSTWPSPAVPQQLHLDTTVPSVEELELQKQRALDLGATLVMDQADDPEEPLYVLADPAGHPLCIFVRE